MSIGLAGLAVAYRDRNPRLSTVSAK
jgi:hypothetical protein